MTATARALPAPEGTHPPPAPPTPAAPTSPSAAGAFGAACTLLHRLDPSLVRWTWPVPAAARPLVRFTDAVAVADEVSIAAAEAGAEDVDAVLLAVFEAVVDAVLALPLAAMRAGHPPVVLDPEHTCLLLGRDQHLAGLWPVLVRDTDPGVRPALGRDLDAVVAAFAPYARGGAVALRTLADARASVLLGLLGRAATRPAPGGRTTAAP